MLTPIVLTKTSNEIVLINSPLYADIRSLELDPSVNYEYKLILFITGHSEDYNFYAHSIPFLTANVPVTINISSELYQLLILLDK